jgi:hypothetical protein
MQPSTERIGARAIGFCLNCGKYGRSCSVLGTYGCCGLSLIPVDTVAISSGRLLGKRAISLGWSVAGHGKCARAVVRSGDWGNIATCRWSFASLVVVCSVLTPVEELCLLCVVQFLPLGGIAVRPGIFVGFGGSAVKASVAYWWDEIRRNLLFVFA